MFTLKEILDLKNGKLQKIVDDIRKTENLPPIVVDENNKFDACEYAEHKSFEFSLFLHLDGILLMDLELKEFSDLREQYHIPSEDLKLYIDAYPNIMRLYKAAINDPMIIYSSPNALNVHYNVSVEHATFFKILLKRFHENKKMFEKGANLFNH